MSEFLELPLASIEVGTDRARPIDPDVVEALAGSIREQGLMQPIVVHADDEGYHLVAGHHRLEAFRLLGREKIPVNMLGATTADEAKLAEVMENLARHELIALDRCQHLFQLKQVWERLYPETAHGKASPKSPSWPLSSDEVEIFGFARANAEKIGLSQTAIKRAVKIWSSLYPTVRTRLRDTALATKQTELKALSEQKINDQIKIMDLITSDEHPEIENVAAALYHLNSGVTPDPLEKRFTAASRTIGALDDAMLDQVLAAHEDRIIASLKRRGRI